MRATKLTAVAAVAAAITCLATWYWQPTASALQHAFGFWNGAGNSPEYLFWSGSGSDLAYLSIISAALIYYRKENCKYKWCPFLGHYDFTDPADGVTRKLCWLHHPDVRHKALTRHHIHDIQQRRHLYAGKHPGKG